VYYFDFFSQFFVRAFAPFHAFWVRYMGVSLLFILFGLDLSFIYSFLMINDLHLKIKMMKDSSSSILKIIVVVDFFIFNQSSFKKLIFSISFVIIYFNIK
jgi:hypothetical protein